MLVFYDFEVKATQEQIDKMYEGATGIILNEMKTLVEKLLSPLNEEIEWQEGYTVIHILSTDMPEIKHYDVTDLLRHKMESAISKRDYEHIMNRIWSVLYPGVIPPSN